MCHVDRPCHGDADLVRRLLINGGCGPAKRSFLQLLNHILPNVQLIMSLTL